MHDTGPAGDSGKSVDSSVIVSLALLPLIVRLGAPWLPANYVAQSFYKLILLAIPVAWRSRVEGHRGLACFWPIDEPRPSRGTWGIAILLAGVSIALGVLCVPPLAAALNVTPESVRARLESRFALSPMWAVPCVLFLSTINAGLEELHYRAWLDRVVSAHWGHAVGIAASAASFSSLHLFVFAGIPDAPWSAYACLFVVLLGAGAAWSLLARRPGGIHAAWLCHGLTDAGFLTWGLVWLGYFQG